MKALLLILLVLGVLVSPGYALPQTVETLVSRTGTRTAATAALLAGPFPSATNCGTPGNDGCAWATSWTWTNPNRVTWEIRLSSVTVGLCKSGAGSLPSGNMRAEIFASTGTLPTGTALATSATRPLTDVTSTGTCTDTFAFAFTEPSMTVSANTEYFAAVESFNTTNYSGPYITTTTIAGSGETALYRNAGWLVASVSNYYLVVEGLDPSIPAQLNQARYVFGVLFVLVLIGGGLSLAYSFFEPDTRGFSRAQLKAKELPIIVALYLSVLAVIGFLAVLYP